jgi:hypothetical protein
MIDNISTFPCPYCKDKPSNNIGVWVNLCDHCDGSGELDWIELIIGKRNRFKDIQKEVTEMMAQQIADDIDREILKGLIGDDINDNGRVSQFMFFDSFKQKKSSKKDENFIQGSSPSSKFLRRERDSRRTDYNKK